MPQSGTSTVEYYNKYVTQTPFTAAEIPVTLYLYIYIYMYIYIYARHVNINMSIHLMPLVFCFIKVPSLNIHTSAPVQNSLKNPTDPESKLLPNFLHTKHAPSTVQCCDHTHAHTLTYIHPLTSYCYIERYTQVDVTLTARHKRDKTPD
jgi:hypothetical protein